MNANFWPRVDVLAGLSMAKYTLEDESNNIKNKNRIPNIFLVNEEKLKAYSEHSKDINSNKFIESQEHQEFKKKSRTWLHDSFLWNSRSWARLNLTLTRTDPDLTLYVLCLIVQWPKQWSIRVNRPCNNKKYFLKVQYEYTLCHKWKQCDVRKAVYCTTELLWHLWCAPFLIIVIARWAEAW